MSNTLATLKLVLAVFGIGLAVLLVTGSTDPRTGLPPCPVETDVTSCYFDHGTRGNGIGPLVTFDAEGNPTNH